MVKKLTYIRDSIMDTSINYKKGFVIVSNLNLKSRCPENRSDVNFESHSLAVFEEYVSFAFEKKCKDVLFVGHCLKSLSLRQALKIMQLKLDVNLHVLACEKHLVNPALIEMKCVNVVGDNALTSQIDMDSTNDKEEPGKYIIRENNRWFIKSVSNKNDVAMHPVPPAIAFHKDDVPGVLFVNKNVKPNFIASTIDDVSYVCSTSFTHANRKLDSSFTIRLKELCDKQQEKRQAGGQDLQSFINEMEISDARSIVQNLYDDVHLSSKTIN